MSELLENILNENYISAQEIFEERLGQILEQKLYEKKKMMQAEVFGGLSKDQIEARKKAGWMKAADYYGAMNKMKELEGKYKSDINKSKEKKKKKIAEGMGDLSQKELETRGKARAKELGAQFTSTASAAQGRAEREKAKRAAKQKRGSTAEPGKPYVAPKVEPAKTGGAPKVELEPADIKKPEKTPTRRERLAKAGYKMLKAKSAGADVEKRYDDAMEKAKGLERRGREGAVSKLKWSKAGRQVGAKRVARDYGKAMGGFAKGIISGLQEDTE